MKKGAKIIFIFLISFIVIEFIAWHSIIEFAKKQYPGLVEKYAVQPIFKSRKSISFNDYYSKIVKFRPMEGSQYGKRAVIIFGCSFAYGLGLDNNQTISHKLSEQMMRPVYNRGSPDWGVQHMLYQLQTESYFNTIKNPEYVIYIFINAHIDRLTRYSDIARFLFGKYIYEYLRYERSDDGNLVIKRSIFPILKHFAVINLINLNHEQNIDKLGNKIFRQKMFDLLGSHFIESKKLINKKWPNAKIIIIDYEDKFRGSLIPDFWEQMQKEGFIYINTRRDFNVGSMERKYRISDTDYHPNEHAWDVIVPQLVKKLNEIR